MGVKTELVPLAKGTSADVMLADVRTTVDGMSAITSALNEGVPEEPDGAPQKVLAVLEVVMVISGTLVKPALENRPISTGVLNAFR